MIKKPLFWLHLGLFSIASCVIGTQAHAEAVPVSPISAPKPQSAFSAETAPGVNLRLSYETRMIGKDGMTRSSTYSDLMYRRPNKVWIERELPVALRESEAHEHHHEAVQGPHAGHAHDAAQGAPLFVERDPGNGEIRVQTVLRNVQRVIDVDLAHYGNVGYGGSWEAAYWMVDPKSLDRMEKVGLPSQGVQRYRLQKGEQTTTVDWDVAQQYVRTIEQGDKHGLSFYRMTAKPVSTPKALPWEALGGYKRGDYSDLLD